MLHHQATENLNPLVAKDADDKLAIDIALNEVAPALEKLKKAGKTRFIGFSGVGETTALHQAIDSKLFDTVQVVLTREAEDRLHLTVWRSFAPHIRALLDIAARELAAGL